MSTRPNFVFRQCQHKSAERFIYISLAISCVAAASYFIGITWKDRKRHTKYLALHDPYERMKEICSYPKKYMITCPSELLKKAEEKGFAIGALEDPFVKIRQIIDEPVETVEENDESPKEATAWSAHSVVVL